MTRVRQVSDIIVCKPGPGVASEAALLGLPILVEWSAFTLPQEVPRDGGRGLPGEGLNVGGSGGGWGGGILTGGWGGGCSWRCAGVNCLMGLQVAVCKWVVSRGLGLGFSRMGQLAGLADRVCGLMGPFDPKR